MENLDRKNNLRTLWLCTLLHGLTHIYHVALIPLYVLIRRDLMLASDSQATALVTVLGGSYFLPSYFMGVLADRRSRKHLLSAGLVINATGFIGLAFCQQYWTALVCLVLAGFGGSFFHPAATALIAQLFPNETGKALGKVALGASCGFFIGPIYSGWRAAAAGWRAPVLELGIFGLIVAILFHFIAREHERTARNEDQISCPNSHVPFFTKPGLWMIFLFSSFAFAFRDFAGNGMASLSSLFLQHARDFDSRQTGFAVSCIFIGSLISNPLFGSLSDRSRYGTIVPLLVISASLIAVFPWLNPRFAHLSLAVYGFFFLATYPMVEAALMESVDDAVRGRVFGLFITIGGFLGNLAHWIVGIWVKALGPEIHKAQAYQPSFAALGVILLLSIIGLGLLKSLSRQNNVQRSRR